MLVNEEDLHVVLYYCHRNEVLVESNMRWYEFTTCECTGNKVLNGTNEGFIRTISIILKIVLVVVNLQGVQYNPIK